MAPENRDECCFPELMVQGWQEVRLGDVVRVIVSNVDKKTRESEKPVRLCNYTDVYQRDAITPNQEFMEATATVEQIKKFGLKVGDVIITKDSETANDIAMPTYVDEVADDLICGYHLAIIRPSPRTNGRFLKFFFELPHTRYYFGTRANGAIRFGLTIDGIEGAKLNLPPVEEQRHIADILSTWDRAIETTKALLAAARTQKRALMQSLLTGKRRFPEFEGQDWEEVRVGNLGKCIRGVSYKSNQVRDSESSETMRLYRSTNIQNGEIVGDPFVLVPRSIVTDERVLQNGDLAVCMSNGSKALVGKSAPIRSTGENHTVGAFCAIFRTHNADLRDFVRFLFESPAFDRHIFLALAGSSINNLKNDDIQGMRFSVPPSHTEMIAVARVLNETDREIVSLTGQIEKLHIEKKALMQQLLTGKRRVKVDSDVGRIIEEAHCG